MVTNRLTFLSLGSSAVTFSGVDDGSAGPITFPTPLQFGSTMQSEAYVRNDSYFSFSCFIMFANSVSDK